MATIRLFGGAHRERVAAAPRRGFGALGSLANRRSFQGIRKWRNNFPFQEMPAMMPISPQHRDPLARTEARRRGEKRRRKNGEGKTGPSAWRQSIAGKRKVSRPMISKACEGPGETSGEAERRKPQENRCSRPQNEIAGFAARNGARARLKHSDPAEPVLPCRGVAAANQAAGRFPAGSQF